MRPEWVQSQKSKISKKPRPRRSYALRLKAESSAILWDSGALLLRFLAESNRRKRFCRPVPNHSAKEPCVVCACKVTKFLPHTQAYDAESCARGGIKSKMRISKRDAHLIACLVSVERKTGLKPATLSLEG